MSSRGGNAKIVRIHGCSVDKGRHSWERKQQVQRHSIMKSACQTQGRPRVGRTRAEQSSRALLCLASGKAGILEGCS